MIFSSNLDRHKIIPLVYVKFWRQDCLLKYAVKTRTLSIMVLPKFAPNLLLQRLSGFISIGSEIAPGKLLFLGRLITEPKMAQSIRSLFMSRAGYFDASVTSIGVLPSMTDASNKYLFYFFVSWFHDSTFPTYSNWKWVVKT